MLKLRKLFFSFSLFFLIHLSVSTVLFADDKPQKHVNVLAPLTIGNPYDMSSEESVNAWQEFDLMLAKLKEAGVNGLEFDIWWGLVEIAPNEYDWSYYDKMLALIEKHGLEPIPILSFHKLGESVDDGDKHIDMPKHVIIKGENVLYKPYDNYENVASKEINNQAVAPWGFQSVATYYKNFMQEFRSHFGTHKTIKQVIISAGPAGELRYASYTETQGYPGPGRLMVYTSAAIQSFRDYAKEYFNNDINKLNDALSFSLSSFDGLYPPTGKDFFKKGYHYSEYGKFFFKWYHEKLIAHGKGMLSMAVGVFNLDPDSPFADGLKIRLKIAGLHWNFNQNVPNEYRLTEMFAGYIVPGQNADQGYKDIMKMIKEESDLSVKAGKPAAGVIYTAIEMSNHTSYAKDGTYVVSKAKDLAIKMSGFAEEFGIDISGENALPTMGDPNFWTNMLEAINDGYSEATLLRSEHFEDANNMDALTKFIQGVRAYNQTEVNPILSVLKNAPYTSITTLNINNPSTFTYENIKKLIDDALTIEDRSEAIDQLNKAMNIIVELNKAELNVLKADIADAEAELIAQDRRALLGRISVFYGGAVQNSDTEMLVFGMIDYLTNCQNGNISKQLGQEELISLITLGTAKRDFKDSLLYWANDIIANKPDAERAELYKKLGIFSLLLVTNNEQIKYCGETYSVLDLFSDVIKSEPLLSVLDKGLSDVLGLDQSQLVDSRGGIIKMDISYKEKVIVFLKKIRPVIELAK